MSGPWEDFKAAVPEKASEDTPAPWLDFSHKPIQDAPNKPSESNSLVDTAKTVGKSVLNAALPEVSTAVDAYNSPMGQKAQEISGIPMRGLRGVMTGAANLDQGPQAALQRASEATQPGFEPKNIQENAADIGAQLLDPRNIAGSEMMAGPVQKGAAKSVATIGDLVNEGLAKLSKWKLGASVPEQGAEIAAKAKFNLPTVTPEEIETGVSKVQDALNTAKTKVGKVLNDAKEAIGIPASKEAKEASLLAGKGLHGLGKEEVNSEIQVMLDSKTPEELSANIAKFKQMTSAGTSDPKLTARVANALQQKVGEFVDWQKPGSEIEGLLKKQYGDLGQIVTDHAVGLTGAKAEMSKTLDVFNDLERQLSDKDKPGAAQDFLRRLFTKESGKNQDYLNRLAQLEEISGKPVLTDLFKQFTGEAYGKKVGSPKLASAAATEIGASLLHLNLPGVAAGTGYLAAQSPAAIKMAGQINASVSKSAEALIKSKLGKGAILTGLNSLKNDRVLQAFRDKLKNKS